MLSYSADTPCMQGGAGTAGPTLDVPGDGLLVARVVVERVLDVADALLHLAFGLVHHPFALLLAVAGDAAESLLAAPLELVDRAAHLILGAIRVRHCVASW